MRTIQSEEKNVKATPLLEWQTCESDTEWQSQQVTLTNSVPKTEGTLQPSWGVRHWRLGALLLLILATIGGWTWSVAQRGVDQIEAELRDSVELDLWTTSTRDIQETHQLSTVAQSDFASPLTSTVELLAFPGESAIVQLVIQSGADQQSLRQTRFFGQTAEGWLRTEPDDELWGTPRSLESGHFIFQYRQNDALAVAAVAPQIDALYTKLLHNFGLTPNAEKLVIEVTVEQVTGATPIPQWPREPLVVPSPAVYLAPVELSDSAILAQSIALPLSDYMAERVIEEHTIPPRWRPLLRGLRLWQMWDLDMPLARWRQDIVKALYTDTPTDMLRHQDVQSDSYAEFCAMHRLWMLSPEMVGIPFKCGISDEESWVLKPWLAYGRRTHLFQLNTPLKGNEQFYDENNYFFNPTEVVTIATLLQYVVTTYGHEQLPVLLANMAQYDDWETLVPAVFDVSAPDFEAGWRSYLAEQYKVSLDH